MKFFNLLLLSSCILIASNSFGQEFEKVDSIKSLKLNDILTKKINNGFEIQGLDVDRDGVLRAEKGYEIVFLEDKQEYVIKPVSVSVPKTDNIDVREEGGLTIVCHCGFGAGDDCQFYPVPNGSETRVFCGGRCPCGSFCFVNLKSVLQYETMDGR